jgi:hypothetical protein
MAEFHGSFFRLGVTLAVLTAGSFAVAQDASARKEIEALYAAALKAASKA